MSDQVSKPETINIEVPFTYFKDDITATEGHLRNEHICHIFRKYQGEVNFVFRELIQPPSDKFLNTERETRLKEEAAQQLGYASNTQVNLTDKAVGSEALKYIRDCLQRFVRAVGTKIQGLYPIFEGVIENLDKLEDNESTEVLNKRLRAAGECKEHIEALDWEVKGYRQEIYFPPWIFEPGIQNVAHEIGYEGSELVDSVREAWKASRAAKHAVDKLFWFSSRLEDLVKD